MLTPVVSLRRRRGAGLRPHLIAPGTIDLHTHGAGLQLLSGLPEDALTIARYRATTGATALLPTITGTWDELLAALPKLAGVAEGAGHGDRTDGAAIVGIHVEGPFLNPERRGAISPATMRLPDVDDLRRLQDAAWGWIKCMTVAPELPGAWRRSRRWSSWGSCLRSAT